MKKERKYTQVAGGRFSPPVITLIALLAVAGISLCIRIALPYDQVFVHGSVFFKGIDPWRHLRIVDNLIHHFPHRISFDPFYYYPSGSGVGFPPFFDFLIATVSLIFGLGSPSQHTVDLVGAYLPAILGTLIIIPVYIIGRELFNRWVGVLSAALAILLPGEFLHRSLLGFTDHHVAESLFTATTIMFLVLALKGAEEREFSFSHLLKRDWASIKKPLIYTLLTGIFLAVYLLNWVGGLFLVFVLFAWLALQFLINHLRGKSIDYLCFIGVLTFLIASAIYFPLIGKSAPLPSMYRASLLIAILMPLVFGGISRLMASKAVRPYYPLALAGLAGIGFAVFHSADPSLLHSMLDRLRILSPFHGPTGMTVIEVHPLLLPYGNFSLEIAWLNFTTSFFISFISLGLLIHTSVRKESADKTLFLVWSVIMLVAVLSMRRFSYYYAINAALLTGYFSWWILDFAGVRKLQVKPVETVKFAKKAKGRKAKAREKVLRERRNTWIKVILSGVAIFFLVFFPNISKAKMIAQHPPLITEGWYSSLKWLKNNSPEPFGDPDFYYKLYPPRHDFKYPESAYGVLSW